MAKKLSLLIAAVAVVAFAVPAMANASQVTSSAGVTAPVGSIVKGTNVGNVNLTSSTLGSIICEHVTIEGELTKNNGTEVEAGEHGEGTTSACTNNGNSVTVTKLKLTNLKSTTSGAGTASFTTTEDVAGLTCVFTGTNVPFTYSVGSDSIVFASAAGVKSSPSACGTAKLDATFTLTIEEKAVILD